MRSYKDWVKIMGIRFYRHDLSKAEILAIKVLLERVEGISEITVACDKSRNVYQVTYWLSEPRSCGEDTFFLRMSYQYHIPFDYTLILDTVKGRGEVPNCSCSRIPGEYKPYAWPA